MYKLTTSDKQAISKVAKKMPVYTKLYPGSNNPVMVERVCMGFELLDKHPELRKSKEINLNKRYRVKDTPLKSDPEAYLRKKIQENGPKYFNQAVSDYLEEYKRVTKILATNAKADKNKGISNKSSRTLAS